jgi:hypothetical protein
MLKSLGLERKGSGTADRRDRRTPRPDLAQIEEIGPDEAADRSAVFEPRPIRIEARRNARATIQATTTT